jgi:uncharacterized protein YdeI (YjbR/CyaY-like superfamily)
MPSDSRPDFDTLRFADQKAWEKWLKTHHVSSPGVWMQLARTSSGNRSVTYSEAIEVALCYGWIDGQRRRQAGGTWLLRFTPRGKKSIWSKINREKASALIESDRMRPAGMRAIESAKADGRWMKAYDSPRTARVPADLQAALDTNARAKAFFATLESRNRYAILWRVQTAKLAATRAKRIVQCVGMLERGEKFHP